MNDLKALIIRHRKPLLAAVLAVAAVCWFLGSSFVDLISNKIEFNRLTRLSAELDKQKEDLQKRLGPLQKQNADYLETGEGVQYHMSAHGVAECCFTPN